MLELQTAFGLHEGNLGNGIVEHTDVLDAQDGDGPALVDDHFEWRTAGTLRRILRDEIPKHGVRGCGYGDGALFLVKRYHALHAFRWQTVVVSVLRQTIILFF